MGSIGGAGWLGWVGLGSPWRLRGGGLGFSWSWALVDGGWCGCFGGKKNDGQVRLELCWYVEELNGWVGIFMYSEYGASRAAFGELVVEG